MNGDPAAASHLADLDARFESHLAELRLRAARFRDALAAEAADLGARLAPGGPEPPAPDLSPADAPPLAADAPLWHDSPNLT